MCIRDRGTKSAGHGDFHPIVLAPSTVQEAIDLTVLAFDLAEKYRTLAFVIADGAIGQMMEPAELPEMRPLPEKRPAWAVTGAKAVSYTHLDVYKRQEKPQITQISQITDQKSVKSVVTLFR